MKGLDGLKIIQVECGGMHTVALTDKGKVAFVFFVTFLLLLSLFKIVSLELFC